MDSEPGALVPGALPVSQGPLISRGLSMQAPRSPSSPGAAPVWPSTTSSAQEPPRGGPSQRPDEPECVDAALGRHLQLLGAALLARSAQAPGKTADAEATLRAEILRVEPDMKLLAQVIVESEALRSTDLMAQVIAAPEGKRSSASERPDEFGSRRQVSSLSLNESLYSECQDGDGENVLSRPRPRKLSESILASRHNLTPTRSNSRRSTQGSRVTMSKGTFGRRDEIHHMLSANTDCHVDELSRLGRVVLHPYFEYASVLLVVANTVAMMVEEQFLGSKVGYDVGFYEYYGSPAYSSTYMPGGEDFFMYLEYFFAAMFSCEAVLKMAGLKMEYWRDWSELFDLFIVVSSNVGILVDKLGNNDHTLNNIQIFRLLRIIRILRIVRLIGALKALDSLNLMTTALHASRFTLMWSFILLFVMQSFVAIIMTNALRAWYLLPGALGERQTHQLLAYFGTYTRSMLSMFELTLANWPPIARFMTDELHEGWMVFAIAYKLTFGFAVVGVINAVFVQETFGVASNDDGVMVRKKKRASDLHRKKMEMLFKMACADDKDEIGAKDLRRVLGQKSIQTWLESMDLDASDADLLFALLKGDGNTVSKEQLIRGVARLKGPARSIDVQMIIRALKEQLGAQSDPWSFMSCRPQESTDSGLFGM